MEHEMEQEMKLGEVKGAVRMAKSKAIDALNSARTILRRNPFQSEVYGWFAFAAWQDIQSKKPSKKRTGSVRTKITSLTKHFDKIVAVHVRGEKKAGRFALTSPEQDRRPMQAKI
eukprot:scaffold6784_cov108-Cylindrotheca_fusiformis.AAC.12